MRRAVVAKISLRDVMVIHLDELGARRPRLAMRTCVELGHALGNQHWPALVKGTRVYVPLTVDRKVMASVMNTHRFEDIRYEFVPGGEVVPYLAPHESRRLFGGAEGPVHTHVRTSATHAASARCDAGSCTSARAIHDAGRCRGAVSDRPGAPAAVRRFDVSDRRLLPFPADSNRRSSSAW